MAAHLRDIEQKCQYGACRSVAKVQLYNARNAPMGTYCRKHGPVALREFTKTYPDQG